MKNDGWDLESCKALELSEAEKAFLPNSTSTYDHSECKKPEDLAKKIVGYLMVACYII